MVKAMNKFSFIGVRLTCKIAWTSLGRRRSRSILVVIMIAASLWGLLFIEGIYDGMTEQLISNSKQSSCGDIIIFAKGYRLDPGIDKNIQDKAAITDLLRLDPGVKSFVQRIVQNGLVATARYAKNGTLYGINLVDEARHSHLDKNIQSGNYNFGAKNKGAIIGSRLAEKLHLQVGKKILFSAQNMDNEVTSIALRVTGIIKSNNMNLDETAIFIDRERAAKLLGLPGGVTEIAITTISENDNPGLQQKLQQTAPDLEIFRWDEMYPALLQSRVMMQGFNMIICLLIFGVAALGILGVITVSVLERLREFGIMLAIGTSYTQICLIVITESLFLGLCGYLLGAVSGGATLMYFYHTGLDLTMFSEGLEAFGMDSIIFAVIKPEYFTTAFLAILTAVSTSVFFPLRLLYKTKPIEAINSL